MDAIRRQLKGTGFLQIFALWALFTAAGCDRFLVSICKFEDLSGCNPLVDGVSPPPDVATVQEMYPVPQRNFEWRAKININLNTKFVGMYQGEALTWKNDAGVYFQSWILDLTNKEEMRRTIVTGCNSCPIFIDSSIGEISFASDQIYAVGGLIYKLKYQKDFGVYYYPSSLKIQVPGIKLSNMATPRPFTHPSINFLVASIQDTPGYKAGIAAFQAPFVRENVDVNTNQLTSFVVGDLDINDQTMNGLELILFGDSTPHWLAHLPGIIGNTGDPELLGALATAISSTKSDESPIDAAFITDLNNDSLPDLIYARKGSLYVTSYMGNRIFKNWSAPVKLDEASGESIKSLVAVNITDAAFPDLVIETNKAVHFYQNKAK